MHSGVDCCVDIWQHDELLHVHVGACKHHVRTCTKLYIDIYSELCINVYLFMNVCTCMPSGTCTLCVYIHTCIHMYYVCHYSFVYYSFVVQSKDLQGHPYALKNIYVRVSDPQLEPAPATKLQSALSEVVKNGAWEGKQPLVHYGSVTTNGGHCTACTMCMYGNGYTCRWRSLDTVYMYMQGVHYTRTS